MAPSHGPQFDSFRADSGNPHNGAQADTGYGHRGAEPHGGTTFDEAFTAAAVNVTHGARWDDFGWKPMPFGHGARYDSNFDEPVAGNPDHGTWHDVFRGGAQVRLLVDGKDVEAQVITTHADHGVALARDGRTVEFGLSQLREWRRANTAGMPHTGVKTAEAGDMGVVTAPAASAPERGSQTDANGGQRTTLGKTARAELEDVAKRGSAYGVTQGKGKMRTAVGPFCHGCAKVVKKALSGSSMATHPHVGTCRSCNAKVGKTNDVDDVAKAIDATETATQRQDGGGVGHRTNCPRGGTGPCGAEHDGVCSLCEAPVRDHQALGKTTTVDFDDVLKRLRDLAGS